MKKAKYWIGILVFFVMYLSKSFFVSTNLHTGNWILDYLINSALTVVICILFLLGFGLKDSLKFSFKSCIEGVGVGGVLTIMTIGCGIIGTYCAVRDFGTPLMSTKDIITFIIALFLGAGMQEEFITRGVLYNFTRTAIGNTKKGIITAMSISSILFGLIHLTNLNGATDTAPIYSQVIYAMGIGFFIAAIYVRCGNIWICAILHTLFDLSLMIYYLIFPNKGLDYISQVLIDLLGRDAIVLKGVIITVIFTILGLFLIRDSKLEKCIERYEEG